MGATEIIQAHPAVCQRCRHCVRRCPVKAIRVTETALDVALDRCVQCGQCVVACSQAALFGRSDAGIILELINSRPTVAIVTTEAMAMLPHLEWPVWQEALLSLGFYAVEDGKLGARAVALAYEALLLAAEPQEPLIRSSCPAVVRYVERFQPDLVDFLAPIAPPYIAQARLIAELYPEKPAVMAITPCLATKSADVADGVTSVPTITPQELLELLDGRLETFRLGSPPAENPQSGPAPASIVARGFDDVVRVLSNNGDALSGCFYDLLACGYCSVNALAVPALPVEDGDAQLTEFSIAVEFAARPVTEEKVDQSELAAALFSAGLATREWQLNCTICGYPTCEDHARAVIRGNSDWSACLPSQNRRFATTTAKTRGASPVDPISGLMNRRGILRVIENEAKRVGRYRGALSLVVLGVEGLSDKVLVLFSQLLLRQVREMDAVGRLAGDHFVIVLPQTDDRAAQAVADKLVEKVAATVFWLDENVAVRLQVGAIVVQIDNSKTDAAAVLAQAEEVLGPEHTYGPVSPPER